MIKVWFRVYETRRCKSSTCKEVHPHPTKDIKEFMSDGEEFEVIEQGHTKWSEFLEKQYTKEARAYRRGRTKRLPTIRRPYYQKHCKV